MNYETEKPSELELAGRRSKRFRPRLRLWVFLWSLLFIVLLVESRALSGACGEPPYSYLNYAPFVVLVPACFSIAYSFAQSCKERE